MILCVIALAVLFGLWLEEKESQRQIKKMKKIDALDDLVGVHRNGA